MVEGDSMRYMAIIIFLISVNNSAFSQTNDATSSTEIVSGINSSPFTTIEQALERNTAQGKEILARLIELEKQAEKESKKKEEGSLTYITPIVVAFFAGFLALLQVKSNIISASRISWIENLRSSLSQFIGEGLIMNFHYGKARGLKSEGNEEEAMDLYENTVPQTIKMAELSHKIRLHLNSTEESHIKLEKSLRKFEVFAIGSINTVHETDELYKATEEIISTAKVILKETWEDSKAIKIRDLINFRY